jgi:DNA primase
MAMNYLLPHIKRIPDPIVRDQFVSNAADRLEINAPLLREELRQAALKRQERVEVKTSPLTGVERMLLRALCVNDPEHLESRSLAAEALTKQPTWFEQLGTFPTLQALAGRRTADPMEVVEDQAQRALLAEALLHETRSPSADEVEGAIQQAEERALELRQRALRGLIAEAERRGDASELAALTQQKLQIDKALRLLHDQSRPER